MQPPDGSSGGGVAEHGVAETQDEFGYGFRDGDAQNVDLSEQETGAVVDDLGVDGYVVGSVRSSVNDLELGVVPG